MIVCIVTLSIDIMQYIGKEGLYSITNRENLVIFMEEKEYTLYHLLVQQFPTCLLVSLQLQYV